MLNELQETWQVLSAQLSFPESFSIGLVLSPKLISWENGGQFVDLSHPSENSVNDGISESNASMQYSRIDDVAHLILYTGVFGQD